MVPTLLTIKVTLAGRPWEKEEGEVVRETCRSGPGQATAHREGAKSVRKAGTSRYHSRGLLVLSKGSNFSITYQRRMTTGAARLGIYPDRRSHFFGNEKRATLASGPGVGIATVIGERKVTNSDG